MTSHTFGAFIDVESSTHGEIHAVPSAPAKAFPRVYHSAPDAIELDSVQWGAKLNGPSVPGTPSGTQTPRNPLDLEMSSPGTPHNETEESVNAIQSFSNPPINRYRMLAVCLLNLGNGLNDSAPGALIPYMEKQVFYLRFCLTVTDYGRHYGIGYAIVSLIFVTNAIGFISAAFFVDVLDGRFGRAKTLMLSQVFACCGFIPIVCTPPFPVIVACFLLIGLGEAINVSSGNTFAANLQNGTTMLGAMHGSYGIGGTIGPLIATAVVTKGHTIFSRYYFLPLGVAIFNLCFAGWSFWHFEADSNPTLLTTVERISSNAQNEPAPSAKTRAKERFVNMLKAFKTKTVILGALFIFAYQGAEVSISGWVISFLISTRNGDPSAVGYVTSGFWAGITLGRFLLSHPAHKVGEKLFVYAMVVLAGAFQLLVWWVPNIIGDAVAVSIVGLVLGPVYPCATVIFSRAIRKRDQLSSLSVISAFGSSGGAIAPFTTGILAQAAGTFVLHPIAIGLFVVMLLCWYYLPTPGKRTE